MFRIGRGTGHFEEEEGDADVAASFSVADDLLAFKT
jgi:hypothetical protein